LEIPGGAGTPVSFFSSCSKISKLPVVFGVFGSLFFSSLTYFVSSLGLASPNGFGFVADLTSDLSPVFSVVELLALVNLGILASLSTLWLSLKNLLFGSNGSAGISTLGFLYPPSLL